MRDLNGKKVVIVGAARQGAALARYMVSQGAYVTINDQKSEHELESIKHALDDVSGIGHPISWAYGGHPLSLLEDCDVMCVSGGVPITIPLGIPVTVGWSQHTILMKIPTVS